MIYEPTFDCLAGAEVPAWLADAKFGVWSHWGPQSVPMCGDWYARNMYIEGTPQYLYHVRHYGHPSRFGYKDICALWHAERFDPNELMELYYRAGARYFVAQAMHHDHFFNYPSAINRVNSARIGPKQDICGLWKQAAEAKGLPFGLTEHLSASFSWWRVNKGADSAGLYAGVPYDGNDPEWRDFYFDNYEHGTAEPAHARPWFTSNRAFHDYWLRCMEELIDRFAPDMLYTDGTLPFGGHWVAGETPVEEDFSAGLSAVARLHTASEERYGRSRAVYTQKNARPEIARVGILDLERSQLPGIAPRLWQTDTSIGDWFYDTRTPYKSPAQIVEMLVDIISKNGVLLINVPQLPDGTIDDVARWTMEELAKWFAVCGEAVHGTRPWRVFGEGESRVRIEGFREDKTAWTGSDVRFTCRGDTLYAFLMAVPDNGVAVIKSICEGERVRSVRLLGAGPVEFSQAFGVLTAKLPERMPVDFANCLAIHME